MALTTDYFYSVLTSTLVLNKFDKLYLVLKAYFAIGTMTMIKSQLNIEEVQNCIILTIHQFHPQPTEENS